MYQQTLDNLATESSVLPERYKKVPKFFVKTAVRWAATEGVNTAFCIHRRLGMQNAALNVNFSLWDRNIPIVRCVLTRHSPNNTLKRLLDKRQVSAVNSVLGISTTDI